MWTLGYGRPQSRYELDRAGRLVVDGTLITDEEGWIDVAAPDEAREQGAPDFMALRVGVVPDAFGRSLLYATEVRVGEYVYSGLAAARLYRADFGALPALTVLLAEMDHRVRERREGRDDGWGSTTPANDGADWNGADGWSDAPPTPLLALMPAVRIRHGAFAREPAFPLGPRMKLN